MFFSELDVVRMGDTASQCDMAEDSQPAMRRVTSAWMQHERRWQTVDGAWRHTRSMSYKTATKHGNIAPQKNASAEASPLLLDE